MKQKIKLTDQVLAWLDNSALAGVGESELDEMERIFHALKDAGAPAQLVQDWDRLAGGYAVRLAHSAFIAGIQLAKDPIGYLVEGKPYECEWDSQWVEEEEEAETGL